MTGGGLQGAMVVNLGLPKTGTTTLARALRRAGLRVADWRIRPGQGAAALTGRLVGRILYEDYFASGAPLARLGRDFDAITEAGAMAPPDRIYWPQTDWALIDAIRRTRPETLFLLSMRDPEAAARSMRRWHGLGTARLPQHSVPGLPPGFGARAAQLARWIDGHQRAIPAFFAGDPRFLAYDIADPEAPRRIGGFLGLDLPWWGRANRCAPAAADAVEDR
ncbi:sulfotransferase [Roseivivax sp. CAU 1761]